MSWHGMASKHDMALHLTHLLPSLPGCKILPSVMKVPQKKSKTLYLSRDMEGKELRSHGLASEHSMASELRSLLLSSLKYRSLCMPQVLPGSLPSLT